MLNLYDINVKLKAGQQVAVAQEVTVVQPVPPDMNEQLYICQVAPDVGGSTLNPSSAMPLYLVDLFERPKHT